MNTRVNITQWLTSLGLGKYVASFVSNDIDDEVLPHLSDDDLKELGVSSLGHRKTLLHAIASQYAGLAEHGRGVRPVLAGIDPSTFPSILALPISEFAEETDPVLRLWYACDVVELLLRFAVMAGLAELKRRGTIPLAIIKELRPRIEEPTLGKWRGMASAVAGPLSKQDSALPELTTLVNEVLVPLLDGPRNERVPETSFSALRNRLAHGGGVTKGLAARLLSLWEPRVESLLAQAAWLGELALVVQTDSNHWAALRGTRRRPEVFVPDNAEIGRELSAAFERGDEVVLVRGCAVLPLWPLTIYGVPQSPDPDAQPARNAAPQVYVRRGDVRLQYTPVGSEEVCLSEACEAALETFLAIFKFREFDKERRESVLEVRGFEQEMRKDAERLVGRSEEVSYILRTLRASVEGVLWLTGPAGIGKSYLVARVVVDLLESSSGETIVLPYRFKAGDDRCSRERFLKFAVERLNMWDGLARNPDEGEEKTRKRRPNNLADEMHDLLGRAGENHVLFVLDGLDEIAEVDPLFARELPLGRAFAQVTWLCAGRSAGCLREEFNRERCTHLFEDGVPPMSAGDIRTMLLEKIGPLRKRLIQHDKEHGEEVVNPFIERVAEYAGGLPIYVRYVVGDILSGRLTALGPQEALRLPPSLDRYHEALLRRCSVGLLHQLLTPLVALLAVAKEPLGEDALAELLVEGNVLSTELAPQSSVKRGLAAVASMLRRATTADGGEGHTLFHHSLRQHMEGSEEMHVPLSTRRNDLCRLAHEPGHLAVSAATYVCRWGVSHLLETGRWDEAVRLLTRFDYLMSRLCLLPGEPGVRGIGEDWRRITRAGELAAETAVWEEFWRTREHLLAKGNEAWPTQRILLQLASDHAASSPVTQAANAWIAQGQCDWTWLRLDEASRPNEVLQNACLGEIDAHAGSANACALSADARLGVSGGGHRGLSYRGTTREKDHRVRLWDLNRRQCMQAWTGHHDEVNAVDISQDGKIIVSGSSDSTIRIWHSDSEACQGILNGHAGRVLTVRISPDGTRALSGGSGGTLRLWNLESRTLIAVLDAGRGAINALACDRQWKWAVSAGDGGSITLWDLESAHSIKSIQGHATPVLSLDVSPDGTRAVSGGRDGNLALWEIPTLRNIRTWGRLSEAVSTVAFLSDGRRIVSGCVEGEMRREVSDASLQVWDSETGTCSKRLKGSVLDVYAVRVADDAPVALSCDLYGLLWIWDLDLLDSPLETVPETLCVYSVSASPDGKMAITGNEDGSVRIWDMARQQCCQLLRGHRDRVLDTALAPDGRTVLSSSEDKTVRVWDLDGGGEVRTLAGHRALVDGVAISPDGYLAVSAPGGSYWQIGDQSDTHLRVWKIGTGECVRQLPVMGELLTNRYVSITPDGRNIVTAYDDSVIGLWDLHSGELRKTIDNGSAIEGLIISPDGRKCLCGDVDGEVRIWDLGTGKTVRTLASSSGMSGARALASSADGRLLFVGYYDRCVRAFDVNDGNMLAAAFAGSWLPSVQVLGPRYACMLGLVDGHISVMDLTDGPAPGIPITTAARIWRRPLPSHHTSPNLQERADDCWDDVLSAACPWCGGRFAPAARVLEVISSIVTALGNDQSPCLELPEEAWDEQRLHSECTRCHGPIKLNPFIVDNRGRYGAPRESPLLP